MILMPARYRRFDWRTRAELAAALTATERQRDLAIGKGRALRDWVTARLELAAACFDEDAVHIDRLKVNPSPRLNAQQRREVAGELRRVATEIEEDRS